VAAAKKKSRKELLKEPDVVLTWSTRLLAAVAAHKNAIAIGVIGLLAAAALYSGYQYYVHRQEARAGVLLQEAMAKYERLRAGESPEKAAKAVAEDFQRLIADYGSRANGDTARLIYGNILYEAGDFSRAAELYRALQARFGEFPLVRFQVIQSLGYTLAALQDDAGAARTFEAALAVADPRLADGVLYQLGTLYARLGQTEKSTAAFKRILADHPDSAYVAMVKERVSL
jgi:tetratricopeptide (TPR) repeat protein